MSYIENLESVNKKMIVREKGLKITQDAILLSEFIKKYFDKEEIEVVRILTIAGCLVIMGIFIFMGFNWYKEDYYAIIYTFPYKVLMYFKETQISIEKIGIIKTLESRYFVYAMVVNMGFYLGTLKKTK